MIRDFLAKLPSSFLFYYTDVVAVVADCSRSVGRGAICRWRDASIAATLATLLPG
jgi:hypothetical protein